ncbi:MAG: hypothetical protein KGL39_33775 [Patescibacteria group bacterium]|nr:hypothetical protein [Patescibacteria group bacterium]
MSEPIAIRAFRPRLFGEGRSRVASRSDLEDDNAAKWRESHEATIRAHAARVAREEPKGERRQRGRASRHMAGVGLACVICGEPIVNLPKNALTCSPKCSTRRKNEMYEKWIRTRGKKRPKGS